MNRFCMLASLTLLASVACDDKKPVAVVPPVPTPVVTVAAVPVPSAAVEEEVETEEDCAAEAEQISKATMESELSKIEKSLK
jgi:hypothetical protein